MTPPSLVELRCAWGLRGGALILDAELLEVRANGVTSRVLCHGAPVLQPRHDSQGLGPQALAWITGKMADVDGWRYHPGHLPDPVVTRVWGDIVAAALETGIGQATMDELFHGAPVAERVRLVFTARDARTAQIPVETMRWPRGENLVALRASVLRTPQRLIDEFVPKLWAGDPGRYVSTVLNAAGVGADKLLVDLRGVIDGVAGRGTAGGWIDAPREIQLADVEVDSAVRLVARHSDLLAICGHADPESGLCVGPDGQALASEFLADALWGARGASVVILAMCGSGVRENPARLGAQPSMAECFAERGAGIVVAFQGNHVDQATARTFMRSLMRAIAPALRHPDAGADGLAMWESALLAGRNAVDEKAIPVIYVHPGLLAGRARRPAETRRVVVGCTQAIGRATPFYVPGQIVIADAGDEADFLRLPVPVDVGRTIEVRLTSDRGPVSIDGTALAQDDTTRLAQLWFADPDLVIRVTADGPTAPAHWAARSAELSAVVRAISHLTASQRVPSAVLELLDAAVATDWGAHDAAPRLVSARGGRKVHLGQWPPLATSTRALKEIPHWPKAGPPALTATIEEIVATFDSGGGALTKLVFRYGRHFAKHVSGAGELASHATSTSRFAVVVLPAAAHICPQAAAPLGWYPVGLTSRDGCVGDVLTH